MNASDLHKHHVPSREAPHGSDWLRVVAIAVVIVLICVVWTFST